MTLFPYIGLGRYKMCSLFSSTVPNNELFILIYQIVLLILSVILFNLGVRYRNGKDL